LFFFALGCRLGVLSRGVIRFRYVVRVVRGRYRLLPKTSDIGGQAECLGVAEFGEGSMEAAR